MYIVQKYFGIVTPIFFFPYTSMPFLFQAVIRRIIGTCSPLGRNDTAEVAGEANS